MIEKAIDRLLEQEEGLHDFEDGNGPVPAHRHQNPDGTLGGWVADTAYAAHTAFVGGMAQVFGEAEVRDYAKVCGNAKVFDKAKVFNSAAVMERAEISGEAKVYGMSEVSGHARVTGRAEVYGTATVGGFAYVTGEAKVYDEAWVGGEAIVTGTAGVHGSAEIERGFIRSGEVTVGETFPRGLEDIIDLFFFKADELGYEPTPSNFEDFMEWLEISGFESVDPSDFEGSILRELESWVKDRQQ